MNQNTSPMTTVAELFQRMENAYHQTAQANGFQCRGCADNCCLTRFYHHTLTEYLYLRQGLSDLPESDQKRVVKRAEETAAMMRKLESAGQPVRVMCPLNEEERCILYTHRPMICRLHGIPHQLRRPDGQRQVGPGCADFDRQCRIDPPRLLDRTPLYMDLAALEKEIRRQNNFEGRIKMTIAQMLIEEL
ncbi:MAG: YkgJ family cysteine cluster protein [Desulfobacteraceae bacterium]|nr:YkgJ family cysteine cluster protein [Desulfobacteraceae bacterium]